MAEEPSNAVLLAEIMHVKSDVGEVKDKLTKQNGRIRDNETCIARLEERQKTTTGVLATLTLIASTVAAGFGAMFGR